MITMFTLFPKLTKGSNFIDIASMSYASFIIINRKYFKSGKKTTMHHVGEIGQI